MDIKIGDKVKILEADVNNVLYLWHRDHEGEIGIGDDISSNGNVHVKLDNCSIALWFTSRYVELLSSTKKENTDQKSSGNICSCNGAPKTITGICPASDS